MANSEPVIETTETDASEELDFITDSSAKDADSAEGTEEVSDTSGDFWEAFEDSEAESLTTVWVCDVSFEVPPSDTDTDADATAGVARDIFASTTKEKVVNRLFSIISSPDLKEPCDFDATKFTTKQQAIRAFFDGVESRNLFVGLVPVF